MAEEDKNIMGEDFQKTLKDVENTSKDVEKMIKEGREETGY